jgi:hypothetical protein
MGFCFFNNVAVAAKWIRTCYPTKVKKVLVLDWCVLRLTSYHAEKAFSGTCIMVRSLFFDGLDAHV